MIEPVDYQAAMKTAVAACEFQVLKGPKFVAVVGPGYAGLVYHSGITRLAGYSISEFDRSSIAYNNGSTQTNCTLSILESIYPSTTDEHGHSVPNPRNTTDLGFTPAKAVYWRPERDVDEVDYVFGRLTDGIADPRSAAIIENQLRIHADLFRTNPNPARKVDGHTTPARQLFTDGPLVQDILSLV